MESGAKKKSSGVDFKARWRLWEKGRGACGTLQREELFPNHEALRGGT